jgi:hypothetical protein
MTENEFIAFWCFVIFSAALCLIKLSSGRKTYGAGKWPQPITEARKIPKNTEGWDG